MRDLVDVRVLAVGDAMLDRYVSGECSRISPEAPVPLLAVTSIDTVSGGAANVAANLAALGCRASLVAGIGRDAAGRELKRLVRKSGVAAHFEERADAVTTVKTRFVSDGKQMLRTDEERLWDEGESQKEEGRSEVVRSLLKGANVLILSDYAKGFLSSARCRDWIAAASECGIPVVVDPKGTDWEKYAGATCVRPNRSEFAAMSGLVPDVKSESGRRAFERAAKKLCRRFSLKSILVTLSADGMALVGEKCLYLPSQAREVYDVSGAGDTAIAAFAAALGAGESAEGAMRIANVAAGLAVAKAGTSVVTAEELVDATPPSRRGEMKILSLGACVRAVRRLRADGRRIGFTNGCFDCCHLGHLFSIREARALCDVLVVGVNADAWIRRHKGKGRPIQDARTRMAVLAAMADVDFVVPFGDETAERLVKAIRPDVIAKEGYPLAKWPEGRLVEKMGGRAVALKRVEGCSTTAVVEGMKQ